MEPLLYLLLGVVLGVVIGWLLGSRLKPERADTSLATVNLLEAELRQQLTQRDGDLARTRKELAEASASLAASDARQQAAERSVAEARQTLLQREAELGDTNTKLTQTGHQLATTQAQLQAANRLLAEQRELHERQLQEARAAQEKALADLREAFKALSADALKQTQPEFLRLANETLGKFAESAKGDLSQRQEAIATLVKPLEAQLKTYQERLAQSETTQSKTLGEVRQHLESLAQQSQTLSTETLQLRRVLSSNQARGKWGEETLRRVVEAAEMSVHCDFSEQAQADDKKPDMIIRLPNDRLIIVDAKVPDLDFLSALGTADELKRSELLAAHADKLRGTIRALAERDYPSQFPGTLDYVVLFLPAESLFSAALEGDRDLIVWAAQRRILLTTPASLIALLRSVSVSWQQHEQTVNAREIAEAAGELFARVAKFTEHFERIRGGLAKANDAYNDAVGSYDRMVRPQGERILKLGVGSSGKALAETELRAESLRPSPTTAAEAKPDGLV
ncbi:MAG: DNA recombination protein RmuC [Limisphaerales bacterium]